MHRILSSSATWPLYGVERSRQLEEHALAYTPPHTLMQRAAQAVFRLGRALYPHARRIWVACGPGNNGGDGLLAATAWHALCASHGVEVTVTWHGDPDHLSTDARWAWEQAQAAGVVFSSQPPAQFDLAIDALLGLGSQPRALTTEHPMGRWLHHLQTTHAPVLCVDLPSGLHADSGHWPHPCPAQPQGPRHTLALLTLKPGLFTADGRDAAGDIWLDDLSTTRHDAPAPNAWLTPPCATPQPPQRQQQHSAHKGLYGDVLVLGGQHIAINGQGMTGAALLAARASLHAGAGRVYVGLLDAQPGHPSLTVDPVYPELMLRDAAALAHSELAQHATTVCGCGGGEAVQHVLPMLLAHSPRLVLDADALNQIARQGEWQKTLKQRRARHQLTLLTPHPLEAARLLDTDSATVQRDRLQAATILAERYQCLVALKGSGTVLAAPERTPCINPSGNALLGTAGTGDVLAGMIGAQWSMRHSACPHPTTAQAETAAWQALQAAVYQHGRLADQWPDHQTLRAGALAAAITPP